MLDVLLSTSAMSTLHRQLEIDLGTSVAKVVGSVHTRAEVAEKLAAPAHPLQCPRRRRSARLDRNGVHSAKVPYGGDFQG